MSQEEPHSGIPTRAIHESYLDMQRSLKAYREAKDQQHQPALEQAHGELQQAVLTFYELLRPHIRHESGVNDWWDGELPNYKGNGTPPDPDDGKGVLQVQEKNETIGLDGIDTNCVETLEDWHEQLGYNGNRRIVGVTGLGDDAFIKFHEYQLGLRHLDNWETGYKRRVVRKEGFQADKTEEIVERQRIPIDRLRRAARELADVADKLGALSQFDASNTRTEITADMIEEVKEWEKQNL